MIPNPSLNVLSKKIAFSTLIQYGGKIIQLVLAAMTLKLIARTLSQADYGMYGTVTEYALFFSVVANLGIFANIVRKMADDPLNGKIFINGFFLRIISAAIFFVLAMVVLLLQGVNELFMLSAGLFLLALLFDYVTSVCDAMLQTNYLMGRATFALVLGKFVTYIAVTTLVTYQFAPGTTAQESAIIPLLFVGTLLGSFVTAILSFYFVRQKIQFEWKIDKTFLLTILKISIPFGIINISNNLYFRFLPDYFAHDVLNDSQFATFNISFRVAWVVSLFSTFLMFSVLPGLKEYIDAKHWHKAAELLRKILLMLMASGILLVAVGSWLGPWAIEFFTHKKYILPEFWFIFPLMLLLAAVSYGYDLILIALFALEEDLWLLKRELLALTVALAIFFSSYLVENIQFKILIIILAAICGESLMVILGSLKIRRIFAAIKS